MLRLSACAVYTATRHVPNSENNQIAPELNFSGQISDFGTFSYTNILEVLILYYPQGENMLSLTVTVKKQQK